MRAFFDIIIVIIIIVIIIERLRQLELRRNIDSNEAERMMERVLERKE